MEIHDSMSRMMLIKSKQEELGEKAFAALDDNKDGAVNKEEIVNGTDI